MNLPTYWVGVGAALGVGGIVGFLAGRTSIEGKVRAEYAESVEMLKNSFEKAQKSVAPVINIRVDDKMTETLQGAKDQVDSLSQKMPNLVLDHEPKPFVESIIQGVEEPGIDGVVPQVVTLHEPDYEKAIAATETSIETFVSGGINDYGVSYIEDSDFETDNGFFKYRIDIMMDEHNPLFLMDGEIIDDWDKKLGDSILVDFYRLVPPGVNPVLYVRNHELGEDYEVVMVTQT